MKINNSKKKQVFICDIKKNITFMQSITYN